jgi:hypothetical protein
MAGKSDYAECAVLDWLLGGAAPTRPTSRTVKLFTVNPTDAGGGTEVDTADWSNYAAQTASFGAAATSTGTSSASNSADVDFGTAAATGDVTLTGFGVYDHLGNLLYWAPFSSNQVVQDGNPVKFAAGALVVTED